MKNLIKIPEILYEDKHILVVNKPAGLVVQGAKKEEESFLKWLKDFIKERDNKPGNVFLAVVHKLDKVVSGLMVFAKRSKSAKRLSESFQKKEVKKIYLAEVEGKFEGEGVWEDYLVWNDRKRRAEVFEIPLPEAKKSITLYCTFYYLKDRTFILLFPFTGRKHQLRAVLSKRGHPIVGDRKYGSKKVILKGKAILLHSFYLSFPHPMSKEKLEFWANPPEYFFSESKQKNKILKLAKRVHKYWDSVKYREAKI